MTSHPLPSEPDLAALREAIHEGRGHNSGIGGDPWPAEDCGSCEDRAIQYIETTGWIAAANPRPDVGLREVRDYVDNLHENAIKYGDPLNASRNTSRSILDFIDAALAANPEPARDGLDVERLARALHRNAVHNDKHPDYRGCSVCDPVAANLAAEYDRLAPDRDAPREPAATPKGLSRLTLDQLRDRAEAAGITYWDAGWTRQDFMAALADRDAPQEPA